MIIALPHTNGHLERRDMPCPGMSRVVASIEHGAIARRTIIGRCVHCGERVRVCTTQGGEPL